MAAPYSVDLRRKVVQACERATQSQREVAELFNVSLSFVEALLRQYRRSGGELVRQRKSVVDTCCWGMTAESSYANGCRNSPI